MKNSKCKVQNAVRIENPHIGGLTLEVGFDNANPREAFEVQVRSDGTCVVHQFIEPEAAQGYAFHLNLGLENAGREPVTVPLQINWAEREYDFCYDYMYVGYDRGRDWQMLSTQSEKAITQLQLVVPSGRHLLCCHPKFDTGDYLAMLEQYGGSPGFKRIDVAKTPEGRPISCLRLGNPKGRKTVITTRAHGYETAGAYCLAGWLKYVAKYAGKMASVLDALDLYVFPMINPDAVAEGHCCTAPSGVNFGRELASRADEDSGAEGLTEFIYGLKPSFYMDMHNNTGPHLHDAFRSTDLSKTFLHGHSYNANPLGCAAALASVKLLEGMSEKLEELESWHREGLARLTADSRLERPRVCGTIAAVDLESGDDGGYLGPTSKILTARFLERGFLLRPIGNTIYLLPPYCIEREEIEAIYDCIAEVVKTI